MRIQPYGGTLVNRVVTDAQWKEVLAAAGARAVQLRGDSICSGTRSSERGDLRIILGHAQTTNDVHGAHESSVRNERQQLDEEAGPHLVADRDRVSIT